MEIAMQIRSVSLYYLSEVLFAILLLLLPASSCLPVMQLTTQYCGWGRRETVPLVAFSTAEAGGKLTPHFPLSPTGEIMLSKASSGPELCP